MGEVTVSVKD
jgi:hypothetical protein